MEITLYFFTQALENTFYWIKVLLHIQFILNNTSFSTINKTFNKIA